MSDMKKVRVRFTATFETVLEVPDNATPQHIGELLADVNIPETDEVTYVEDTFEPVTNDKGNPQVYDDDGLPVFDCKFKIGQRVERTMGVKQAGEVINAFSGPYTDGQYRAPERHERPVWVKWDDGTKGWIQASAIRHSMHEPIPADFAVQPLKPGQEAKDKVTCGHCGLSWDDAIQTEWTPAPSARCPFEYFHLYPDEE